MKRKINSRVYQLYFEDKGEADRNLIHSIIGLQFSNYTFLQSQCMWHGKAEHTLQITILDDDELGHRICMRKINYIVHCYNRNLPAKSEILCTVTKAKAYFLNGVEVTL